MAQVARPASRSGPDQHKCPVGGTPNTRRQENEFRFHCRIQRTFLRLGQGDPNAIPKASAGTPPKHHGARRSAGRGRVRPRAQRAGLREIMQSLRPRPSALPGSAGRPPEGSEISHRWYVVPIGFTSLSGAFGIRDGGAAVSRRTRPNRIKCLLIRHVQIVR